MGEGESTPLDRIVCLLGAGSNMLAHADLTAMQRVFVAYGLDVVQLNDGWRYPWEHGRGSNRGPWTGQAVLPARHTLSAECIEQAGFCPGIRVQLFARPLAGDIDYSADRVGAMLCVTVGAPPRSRWPWKVRFRR